MKQLVTVILLTVAPAAFASQGESALANVHTGQHAVQQQVAFVDSIPVHSAIVDSSAPGTMPISGVAVGQGDTGPVAPTPMVLDAD